MRKDSFVEAPSRDRAQAATSRSPRLTIIAGTTQRWPEFRVLLDSVHDQAQEIGAELLAVDGHGQGFPADLEDRYPHVIPIRMPGASIFQMRATAIRQASGDIVAITEDHCRVAPDWCRRILDAHEEYPDAAAIGGVVENGSQDSLLAWAHFFAANGEAMGPVRRGPHSKVALQACVSYKRDVLPRTFPNCGYMEWLLNASLRKQGRQLVADDRIQVDHVQSFPLKDTCAIHFHDSRSIAAFRAQRIGWPERALRLGVALTAMTPLLVLRSIRPLVTKRRHLEKLLPSLPYFVLLAACRSAGAAVGFVAGAGKSPLKIR